MHAAADKDHMTVEDPLGSDEGEEGSENEADGASDGSSGSESGEEEDDDNDEGSGKLLKATLEARQAARAAGDHPLQQSFRAAAAQLLEKYATADKKKKRRQEKGPVAVDSKGGISDEEDKQQGSRNEGLDEEEESKGVGIAGSSEEDEQDASSDAGSSGVSEDGEQPAQSKQPAAAQLDAQRTDRQRAHAEAQSSGQAHVDSANADDDTDDIPYTIPAPSSYDAFAKLAEGQGPARLGLVIRRIRACNAIALATDNRRKLQASIPLYSLVHSLS